ncbi:uncharacterized protein DUF397 [Actinocorallia herbida]|uniref:Uncharacterized protein DUF397 n=1 Tax=Actinocorallia herbida TaxID=58109 RepID=A0A3N1CY66_9ACTN|nr:uncharacterized protein DUF397 [Actinocorallia herbida]
MRRGRNSFRRSTYSAMHDECVELKRDGTFIEVRDSKTPRGRNLRCAPTHLAVLFAEYRRG